MKTSLLLNIANKEFLYFLFHFRSETIVLKNILKHSLEFLKKKLFLPYCWLCFLIVRSFSRPYSFFFEHFDDLLNLIR